MSRSSSTRSSCMVSSAMAFLLSSAGLESQPARRDQPDAQCDDESGHKNHKQHFGDAGRGLRQAAEAQHGGDDGDDQEAQSPSKHVMTSLFSLQASAFSLQPSAFSIFSAEGLWLTPFYDRTGRCRPD